MLSKAGANIADILDSTEDELKEIEQAAKYFGLEELTECARAFAQNELMQKGQGTPQLGLELAFLACVELHRRAQNGHSTAPSVTAPARPSTVSNQTARPRVADSPPATYEPAPVAEYRTPPARPEVARPDPTAEPPTASAPVQSAPRATKVEEVEELPRVPEPHPTNPTVVTPVVPVTPTPVTEEIEAPEAAAVDDPPTLTLSDVKEKWEMIRRRVRTRTDGPKIAALLGGYVVLGVEGTSQLPIVVCKANMDFHYKTLQNDSYYEAIRWALKVELKTECNIRLLPPNANVSIPTFPRPAAPAINTMQAAAPQQSARTERPVPPPTPQQSVRTEKPAPPPTPPAPQARPASPAAEPQQSIRLVPPPEPRAAAPVQPAAPIVPPLARSEVVRENTTRTSANNGTRLQSIRQHAESNPVVTEVIRMFKAEIKEIQPK
ncbi:hypothetical protein KDK_08200 [Dictyobacter kobayashii]|uniref:DNA polymerase III gamma subunit domain-containing protein n=2 Tax=Dictyobacter kobayashii TaxID=2014872 RepID=A0A402AD35_9CHLR|nr:hypothetical protein KDK_08200 [Dictyobacter kobayashii]